MRIWLWKTCGGHFEISKCQIEKRNPEVQKSGDSSSGMFEDTPADGSKFKISNTLKYPKAFTTIKLGIPNIF